MVLSSSSRSKRSRRVRDDTISPYVRRTGGFRRKRIEVIGVERRINDVDEVITTNSKDLIMDYSNEASMLESLPHEILIKVVSCVDHDDLKQLYRVSKTIREAALTAKRIHFAYSTPTKTSAFRTSMAWNEKEAMGEEHDAPGAPLQGRRYISRTGGKKLLGISISLFETERDDVWPGRVLIMEP